MKNTYTVALAGNPNVGKSTIFNSLTGMHQHTGNWTGKTVANATGKAIINDKEFTFVDIPGTYSIMSNSEEEEIARDYICFGNPDATVIVVDSTCLERNLNLVYQIMEITDNIIVCVNLLDEAKKKKIKIDLNKLENLLGVPVVGTVARERQTLENLKNTIYKVCESEIKPHTKTVIYEQEIEENLEKIVEKLDTDLLVNEYSEIRNIATDIEVEENKISKKLYRWIAIKLIDGEEKIFKMCKMFGASKVEYTNEAKEKLNKLNDTKMMICICKTPMSITDDKLNLGYPKDFKMTVTDIKVYNGAGFIVVYMGNVLLMPGMPKNPNYLIME